MKTAWFGIGGCALALAGCSVDISGMSFSSKPAASVTSSVRPAMRDGVLTAEGVCEGDAASAMAKGGDIALGMRECDLVGVKGKPTDVLIGESGKGQRETQVLYSEPTGREIYLFTDNQLTKIVKPGQS